MNRKLFVSLALCATTACSGANPGDGESVGKADQALNGTLSPAGFLVQPGRNIAQASEALRQQDTRDYYTKVGTSATGGTPSITTAFPNLGKFITRYFGTSSGTTASYYNRGDLGLGREMHCRVTSSQETACYVVNYAAGENEFTFGQSRDIAFANLAAHNKVATVAMVFRGQMAPNTSNRLFFVVFGPDDARVDAAALDRHAINFAAAFNANGGVNPDPAVFGTPGQNFNSHIPSNCLNCHGGTYDASTQRVNGGFFLPFDLDQFDYDDAGGLSRASQEANFKALNLIARNVAVAVAGTSAPIAKQVSGWYSNSSDPNTFFSDFVPPNWDNSVDKAVYQGVVRRSCRGCHMTLPGALALESADPYFRGNKSVLSAAFLRTNVMPHALQSQREFWFSSQPTELNAYFIAAGQSAAVTQFASAGPGTVVTLDPQLIIAVR
jgi:hypothetical protein